MNAPLTCNIKDSLIAYIIALHLQAHMQLEIIK